MSWFQEAKTPLSKKCCIHDNFVYVQSVIKALHKSKRPALFIKLDISKAFDSLSWVFLLEVMKALGFGQKWRDWITTLLATSSSRVLLNGILGKKNSNMLEEYVKAIHYHHYFLS